MIASLRLTFIALAPIALTLSLVAPGSVGCGSRNVGGSTDASAPASSAAAPSTPGDKAAAPAPAPAAAAATARGTPAEPVEAAPPPSTAPTAAELAGDYECRFTRGERELTPVTCTIRPGDGGALAMEQTNGNIRLRGVVAPDEAGFRFTGEDLRLGPLRAGREPRDDLLPAEPDRLRRGLDAQERQLPQRRPPAQAVMVGRLRAGR